MVKGKKDPNWKEKVLEWQASGKKSQDWCSENNIPHTTFCGWRERLKKSDHDKASSKAKTGFIELKNKAKDSSGIFLEYAGVKIHLSQDFDAALLKKCLSILRGSAC